MKAHLRLRHQKECAGPGINLSSWDWSQSNRYAASSGIRFCDKASRARRDFPGETAFPRNGRFSEIFWLEEDVSRETFSGRSSLTPPLLRAMPSFSIGCRWTPRSQGYLTDGVLRVQLARDGLGLSTGPGSGILPRSAIVQIIDARLDNGPQEVGPHQCWGSLP